MSVDPIHILELTPEGVATRELNTAIRLFMADEDPVAIYVLAWAAIDVMTSVAARRRPRGTKATKWQQSVEELIVPEYQGDFLDALRSPYNFMKHGGRAEFRGFTPTVIEPLLVMAVGEFHAVFGGGSKEMMALTIYAAQEKPQYLADGPFKDAVFAGLRDFHEAFGKVSKAEIYASIVIGDIPCSTRPKP